MLKPSHHFLGKYKNRKANKPEAWTNKGKREEWIWHHSWFEHPGRQWRKWGWRHDPSPAGSLWSELRYCGARTTYTSWLVPAAEYTEERAVHQAPHSHCAPLAAPTKLPPKYNVSISLFSSKWYWKHFCMHNNYIVSKLSLK